MRLVGIVVTSSLLAACSFSSPGKPSDTTDAPPSGSDAGSDGSVDPDGPPAPTIRRKVILIHGNKITGTQTDFPVWISLTDAEIQSRAQADGSDIFFTDNAGATLDFEIASWAAPELRAWVRVPTLTSGTDTSIFVVYGDKTQGKTPNAPGVFKNNYAAVWHLDDAFTAAQVADATGTRNGTATNLAAGNHGSAQLGGGLVLDGSSTGRITFTNPLAGHADHTITVWISADTVSRTSAIVTLGKPDTDQSRFLYANYGNGSDAGFGYYNDDFPMSQQMGGKGWKMLSWTYHHTDAAAGDPAKDTNDFFVDGAHQSGYPRESSGTPDTQTQTGNIGYAPQPMYGALTGFKGTMDELRISTVARDPSWFATEFASQKDPAHFYAVGDEQPVP